MNTSLMHLMPYPSLFHLSLQAHSLQQYLISSSSSKRWKSYAYVQTVTREFQLRKQYAHIVVMTLTSPLDANTATLSMIALFQNVRIVEHTTSSTHSANQQYDKLFYKLGNFRRAHLLFSTSHLCIFQSRDA